MSMVYFEESCGGANIPCYNDPSYHSYNGMSESRVKGLNDLANKIADYGDNYVFTNLTESEISYVLNCSREIRESRDQWR